MNYTTPLAVVFEQLRWMQGKMQRKNNIIHEDGITYSIARNIADKIADIFSRISNQNNYCEEFKRTQTTADNYFILP